MSELRFQSSPAIAGGRDSTKRYLSCLGATFQSSPAIAGGRDNIAIDTINKMVRFNPRPPLLAGATRVFRLRDVG